MRLDSHVYDTCNRAVLITGVGRSGTTILGNVIHSFKDVEYVFEPPLLHLLFAMFETLPQEQFKLLYETYLYEDFLINALTGRRLNNNREDDSSIFRVKNEEDISMRQCRSWRKSEIESRTHTATIAYKLTDIIHLASPLQSYYPGTKIVMTAREANDVFHSILRKEWFTDNTLRTTNRMWPYTLVRDKKIPQFVKEEDREYFAHADELHRTAYYYLANAPTSDMRNACVVQYRDLVTHPEMEAQRVAEFLGCSFGPKTKDVLGTIGARVHSETEDLIAKLEPSMRERVRAYSPIPV